MTEVVHWSSFICFVDCDVGIYLYGSELLLYGLLNVDC